MAVDYLDNGNPDGTVLGQSTTEKISFYGVTPIVQRSGAAQGTFTTTMTSTSPWGFATSTAADAAVALLTEIRAALVALGLIKGSA
ncbi:MAG: hypothetical protein ACOYWZ_20225 [Bacillota bacterium]